MIELLTVIAIIAILAAILFPIFGTVREQARQSNTMSNLHSIYIAARQFYDDEGRFPPALFGYAEIKDTPTGPARFATQDDVNNNPANITPMNEILKGYLYREHLKDYGNFTCTDNLVTDKKAVTQVYYPLNLPNKDLAGQLVVWSKTDTTTNPTCPSYGDPDLPDDTYVGKPKLFYTMDSMDIGPRLDDYGHPVKDDRGNTIYELHYTPDWTHKLGATCDVDDKGRAVVTQLKYRNPPAERTVITYVTDHAATSGSPNVLVLLLSGTARKVNYMKAHGDPYTLPLYFQP